MTNSSIIPPRLLDTEHARILVEAGGVVAATIKGQGSGWAVQLQTGKGGLVTLAKARGGVRIWRDLARAAAYVCTELKIRAVSLDMSRWDPKQKAIGGEVHGRT